MWGVEKRVHKHTLHFYSIKISHFTVKKKSCIPHHLRPEGTVININESPHTKVDADDDDKDLLQIIPTRAPATTVLWYRITIHLRIPFVCLRLLLPLSNCTYHLCGWVKYWNGNRRCSAAATSVVAKYMPQTNTFKWLIVLQNGILLPKSCTLAVTI